MLASCLIRSMIKTCQSNLEASKSVVETVREICFMQASVRESIADLIAVLIQGISSDLLTSEHNNMLTAERYGIEELECWDIDFWDS